jgi:hypothetical protein
MDLDSSLEMDDNCIDQIEAGGIYTIVRSVRLRVRPSLALSSDGR